MLALVNVYIKRCELVLESKDKVEAKKLRELIISIFESYIKGIKSGLDNYNAARAWVNSERVVDEIGDIEKLKGKLEIFAATKGRFSMDISSEKSMNMSISNVSSNTNINENYSIVQLDLLIENTIKEVEGNISLSEDDIKEVLDKIEIINDIFKEKTAVNKKWFKLKPVIEWTSTKGVGIGISILNLITAIIKSQ